MMSSASKKRKGSLKSKKMQQIKRSKVQAIRNREHVANKQVFKLPSCCLFIIIKLVFLFL